MNRKYASQGLICLGGLEVSSVNVPCGVSAIIASPIVASLVFCLVSRPWRRFGLGEIDFSRNGSRDGVGCLRLWGRCEICKTVLPNWLLIAEVALAVLAATAVWLSAANVPIAVAFVWILFALARCDLLVGRLPNVLTGTLAVLGLIFALLSLSKISIGDAIAGLAAGYLIPMLTKVFYRTIAKRDGLGGGDIKLFAALGAWIGWHALPALLLMSSCTALAVGLIGRRGLRSRVAFGPSIAVSGFALWWYQVGTHPVGI